MEDEKLEAEHRRIARIIGYPPEAEPRARVLRDGRGRPLLEPLVRALLRQVVALCPDELGHVDVDRIVIVGGAARRGTRASIRPLTFGGDPPALARPPEQKPRVRFRGRLALYELCLRPLYFLRCSPEHRLRILVHELGHLDAAFDGSLDPRRRHHVVGSEAVDRMARAVAARVVEAGLDTRVVAHHGEMRVPMWLDRPPTFMVADRTGRLEYDERDLFLGVVRQNGYA